MSAPSSFRFHVREALRNVWQRRSVTILSMATIAASLYLVGLFLLAARGIEPLLGRWTDELSVSVFLSDGITQEQAEAIQHRIASSGAVRSFERLDAAAALGRFRQSFPDLAGLPDLLSDNPFPGSFEIRLRPESGDPDAVAKFAEAFRPLPGVEEVRFDALWLKRVRGLLRAAWLGGAVIGSVLLGAAVLTISAVVRMGVYERREEIDILRLVGANPGFIRAPFLVEGALQGAIGAGVALTGITATWLVLSGAVLPASAPFLAQLLGGFVHALDAGLILVTGTLLGLAGSMIGGLTE